jgi:hypothetical protein
MAEESPPWLADYPIPEAQQLEEQMRQAGQRLYDLQHEIEDLEARRRAISEYQGLLWFEGKPLELVVEKAVNLLGVDAHPSGQIDLAYAIGDGQALYIEVEGTTGAIQVRKGSQLLRYIAEAPDPSLVRGAIIGNPFRTESPANRPPPGSQVGFFSEPLERLAKNQKWKLITTIQLFAWVKIHFAGGQERASQLLREALGV